MAPARSSGIVFAVNLVDGFNIHDVGRMVMVISRKIHILLVEISLAELQPAIVALQPSDTIIQSFCVRCFVPFPAVPLDDPRLVVDQAEPAPILVHSCNTKVDAELRLIA